MHWHPVKQPNGKYAIWEDGRFYDIELTGEDMIYKMEGWCRDAPPSVLKERLAEQMLTALDWDSCLDAHLRFQGGDKMVGMIMGAGLCDELDLAKRIAKARTNRIHDAMSMPGNGFRDLVRVEEDGGIVISDLTMDEAKELIERLVVLLIKYQEGHQ